MWNETEKYTLKRTTKKKHNCEWTVWDKLLWIEGRMEDFFVNCFGAWVVFATRIDQGCQNPSTCFERVEKRQ